MGFAKRIGNLRATLTRKSSVSTLKSSESVMSKTKTANSSTSFNSPSVTRTEVETEVHEMFARNANGSKKSQDSHTSVDAVVPRTSLDQSASKPESVPEVDAPIAQPEPVAPVVVETPKVVLDPNEVLYAGHVSQMMQNMTDWRSYWVSIRHGRVLVFKCWEQDLVSHSPPMRVIELVNCVSIDRERHDEPARCMRYAFKVVMATLEGDKSLYFNAETRAEMNEFIAAFRKAAGMPPMFLRVESQAP